MASQGWNVDEYIREYERIKAELDVAKASAISSKAELATLQDRVAQDDAQVEALEKQLLVSDPDTLLSAVLNGTSQNMFQGGQLSIEEEDATLGLQSNPAPSIPQMSPPVKQEEVSPSPFMEEVC